MRTTADVLIDTIQSWGVDVIFGLPGDGINGIVGAPGRANLFDARNRNVFASVNQPEDGLRTR